MKMNHFRVEEMWEEFYKSANQGDSFSHISKDDMKYLFLVGAISCSRVMINIISSVDITDDEKAEQFRSMHNELSDTCLLQIEKRLVTKSPLLKAMADSMPEKKRLEFLRQFAVSVVKKAENNENFGMN